MINNRYVCMLIFLFSVIMANVYTNCLLKILFCIYCILIKDLVVMEINERSIIIKLILFYVDFSASYKKYNIFLMDYLIELILIYIINTYNIHIMIIYSGV